MSSFIFGASTLTKFSEALEAGFSGFGQPDFELWQVHASPQSLLSDLELLKRAKIANSKKFFLIHRPDELLLYPELKEFFVQNSQVPLIFLGDLVLNLPFWKERQSHVTVIPHPFLDLSRPSGEKYVIGSFTSWGEMRKLEHFFDLAEVVGDEFEFMIGGTIEGRPLTDKDMPSFVKLSAEAFAPHFNVQLYHLNGKKRIGESSGSLHRGISVPIIFEANGIERVEGLRVIKIDAAEDLTRIDYLKAANEIRECAKDMEAHLSFNLSLARKNRPEDFARKIIQSSLAHEGSKTSGGM